MKPLTENELPNKIIGAAIEVHSALGPGLLESAYRECLYCKISRSGLYVEKEKPMPLIFEEVKLECGYRMDLPVEKSLQFEGFTAKCAKKNTQRAKSRTKDSANARTRDQRPRLDTQ